MSQRDINRNAFLESEFRWLQSKIRKIIRERNAARKRAAAWRRAAHKYRGLLRVEVCIGTRRDEGWDMALRAIEGTAQARRKEEQYVGTRCKSRAAADE